MSTETTRVFAAKTNARLAGVASQQLIAACESDPEGLALASLDVTQRVDDGGIWYPGAIIVRHGPRQHVDLYRSRKEREESIFDAEHFGHKWREVKF